MVVEPLGGKGVCCGIPTTDWEREVKTMVREPYLQDEEMGIVMDHLNSHRIWSLYEIYPAAEAFEIG
jgi:hypothetical protein